MPGYKMIGPGLIQAPDGTVHEVVQLPEAPIGAFGDTWRHLASDAIDSLDALLRGNSCEWAVGKRDGLRRRGEALLARVEQLEAREVQYYRIAVDFQRSEDRISIRGWLEPIVLPLTKESEAAVRQLAALLADCGIEVGITSSVTVGHCDVPLPPDGEG